MLVNPDRSTLFFRGGNEGVSMKAAYYRKNGPAREVLEIGDQPVPEAGPGQVLIRMRASGVNPSDVKTRQGQPGREMTGEPRIPHNDGAGIIVAVGADIDPSRMGERVWVHNTGFKRVLGTAAEFVAVEDANAVPLPPQASFEEGACLGVPFLTAYHAVTMDGAPSGKTVLVSGGAGAVGHFAIQIARALGADVIATVSSDRKADMARKAGADFIVNYRTEDVAAAVNERTKGTGADLVVEVDLTTNAHYLGGVIAKNACVAVYGSAKADASLDVRMLRVLLARLHLFNVYELSEQHLSEGRKAATTMLGDGRLSVNIARTFTLDQIADAHEAVESGAVMGNVVITLDG